MRLTDGELGAYRSTGHLTVPGMSVVAPIT
jgi:hypothetical protein